MTPDEGDPIPMTVTTTETGATHAADWPNRPPVNWLNYPGDHRCLVDTDQPLGPNAYHEWMHPVVATYDPVTNRTRVGFTPIAPALSEPA